MPSPWHSCLGALQPWSLVGLGILESDKPAKQKQATRRNKATKRKRIFPKDQSKVSCSNGINSLVGSLPQALLVFRKDTRQRYYNFFGLPRRPRSVVTYWLVRILGFDSARKKPRFSDNSLIFLSSECFPHQNPTPLQVWKSWMLADVSGHKTHKRRLRPRVNTKRTKRTRLTNRASRAVKGEEERRKATCGIWVVRRGEPGASSGPTINMQTTL